MKKLFIAIALLAADVSYSQVQGLTQSAEGKSTIPLRGTAIGIDLAKADLSFGYNNINRVVQTKKVQPAFGLDVKVRNEEGIGNLFNAGNLVPSGAGNLYGGITFSNAFNKVEMANLARRERLVKAFNEAQSKYRRQLGRDLEAYINGAVLKIPAGDRRDAVKADLQAALKSVSGNEETYFNTIQGKTGTNHSENLVYEAIQDFAKKGETEFKSRKAAHINRLRELHEEFTDISFQRVTLFGFGGISAIGFKRFKGLDPDNLSNSFENIDERGGHAGIGVNYQWRNIWLGVTYSRVEGNNFPLLGKKEYTLRNTTTAGTQALVQESKITAYSGSFAEVNYSNLNADIIFRLLIDKDFKNYLLFNPYLRGSVRSADTDLFPNKTNIGTGLYFLQNDAKFLGGIYLELPDVNNNAEKSKPAKEQNIREPLKRLSFGVVTKYNLSSIMGW